VNNCNNCGGYKQTLDYEDKVLLLKACNCMGCTNYANGKKEKKEPDSNISVYQPSLDFGED